MQNDPGLPSQSPLMYSTDAQLRLTSDQIAWLQEVKDPGKESGIPKVKGAQ